MIRVQPTSSGDNQLLVGSDLADPASARREVEDWVGRNGYRLAQDSRRLSVFENGALVREWVLVEANREAEQRIPAGPFGRFWKRTATEGNTARSATAKLLTLRLDEAA